MANPLTQDAPGLAGPPDDDFNEVRWQECVISHADHLAKVEEVAEVIEPLAEYGTYIALQNAINGRPLHPADRTALETLAKLAQRTFAAVEAAYKAPSDDGDDA